MPVLPRLNRLSELLVVHDPLLGVFVHNGVLNADAVNWSVPAVREQCRTFIKLSPHRLKGAARRRLAQPANTAVAKPGARWVRHHEQIPAVIEVIAHIPRNVPVTAVFGWE